jgi:hypothetical protein
MKQLPDIVTSVTFWAAVGTLWSAAGAWFTYVAAAVSSRQQNHDGLMNLIAGVEAEFDLVSEWARGGEGDQGYLLSKTRVVSVQEHPDWFNPSRMIFTFETPALSSLTNSPFAKSVGAQLHTFVSLNHSIRRLFAQVDRLNAFALGDLKMYQSVMEKYGSKVDAADMAFLPAPSTISVPPPHKINWTQLERVYINLIFMMNEAIHQNLIGGAEGPPGCLYLMFRAVRKNLEDFKVSHRQRERLPWGYWILHLLAAALAGNGIWQVLRWFDIVQTMHVR